MKKRLLSLALTLVLLLAVLPTSALAANPMTLNACGFYMHLSDVTFVDTDKVVWYDPDIYHLAPNATVTFTEGELSEAERAEEIELGSSLAWTDVDIDSDVAIMEFKSSGFEFDKAYTYADLCQINQANFVEGFESPNGVFKYMRFHVCFENGVKVFAMIQFDGSPSPIPTPTPDPEPSKDPGAATGVDVHFSRPNVYEQGQFSDVPADQWYTNGVKQAFEFGLMNGVSARQFDSQGNVTIAQAITMAARIHSIYTTGAENFVQSGTWYQVYLDYAFQNGIISYAYYNSDVTKNATRAQFAEIFANALPEEALTAINDVMDGAIPDVPIAESYASHVYRLYRAGILTGSDVTGTFSPYSYITRQEAATIVSRMAESSNRVSFTL